MTMKEFVDTYWLLNTRDKIRGELIGEILQRKGDNIIAVTPMYYIQFLQQVHVERDGKRG